MGTRINLCPIDMDLNASEGRLKYQDQRVDKFAGDPSSNYDRLSLCAALPAWPGSVGSVRHTATSAIFF